MVWELFIICIFFYAMFGEYISARAEIFREQARQLRIENDRKEMDE